MNFKYNLAREKFLTAQLDWLSVDIKLLVVDATYNASPADEFVADISVAAIVARTTNASTKTATDGYARAIPFQLFSLLHGQEIVAAVLYEDTGDDATSTLIAYVDDGIVFPFLPLGLDYSFAYDSIEGGFFRT
jgi:hypothetical protein